jgi:L-iditol 2-dehydrogenase
MGADTVTLDVALLQGRELSVTGVFRYANTYPLALQLISSGAVNVTDIITHRFNLEDTERALTISQTDRNSLKAMVHTAHRTQARATA